MWAFFFNRSSTIQESIFVQRCWVTLVARFLTRYCRYRLQVGIRTLFIPVLLPQDRLYPGGAAAAAAAAVELATFHDA